MSLRKSVTAAAVVSLVFGVSVADAAKPKPKKPVCNIVKDAGKNDATGYGMVTTPNEPTLDIITADVATNAKTLTAVFRVAAADSAPNTAAMGRGFILTFKSGTTSVEIEALVNSVANVWQDGKGTGVVDTAKKEIRVHVPLSALPVALKPNTKITNLRASSWRWGANQDVVLGMADDVTTNASYVVAWPSCVKVGV